MPIVPLARVLALVPAACLAARRTFVKTHEASSQRRQRIDDADLARWRSAYFPNSSHTPLGQASPPSDIVDGSHKSQSLLELELDKANPGEVDMTHRASNKAKQMLAQLKNQDNKFIRTWGEERLTEILEAQYTEFDSDNLVMGFTPAQGEFQRLWGRVMGALEVSAASRPEGHCSHLPDALLSHIWRYRESDVLECLGWLRDVSEADDYCDADRKEVPHSSNWTWAFRSCDSLGAEKCKFPDGGEGCCCPEGKHWEASLNMCVDCSIASPRVNETCELACGFFPEVKATLTCDGSNVTFQGSAPEGNCRWTREHEGVHVRSPLGEVTGLLRPVMMETPAEGVEVQFVRTFWDVPFGKPIKMFTRPEMVEPWSEPMTLPDWYINKTNVSNCDTEDHDDCLTLAVYVPDSASADNLKPVLFWIPGDGFRFADKWCSGYYDAARLALRQDAVIVIANGRSHILGYWANPALAAEDPDHSTGNYGMMDQRLALEWIRDNIRSFGGDPARVTIGGHSSGGFSVNFHLLSPASRGLFSASITEGATVDNGWYFQAVDEAVEFYGELGEALGCPNDNPKRQIDCLRLIPKTNFTNFLSNQLSLIVERMEKSVSFTKGMGLVGNALWSLLGFEGSTRHHAASGEDRSILAAPLFPFLPVGPCVDRSNAGLPHHPAQLVKMEGAIAPVPMYLDFAADEGTLFALFLLGLYPYSDLPSVTHAAVDEAIIWAMGPELGPQVIKEYPRTLWGESPFARLSDVIRDGVFKCSGLRMARSIASKASSPPVHVAENAYVPSQAGMPSNRTQLLSKLMGATLGADHLVAQTLVMGFGAMSDTPTWSASQESTSNLVNCMYGTFMHCGSPDVITEMQKCDSFANIQACRGFDPSSFGVAFPEFDAGSTEKFVINQRTGMVPISDKERSRCEFWDRYTDAFHLVQNVIRR